MAFNLNNLFFIAKENSMAKIFPFPQIVLKLHTKIIARIMSIILKCSIIFNSVCRDTLLLSIYAGSSRCEKLLTRASSYLISFGKFVTYTAITLT